MALLVVVVVAKLAHLADAVLLTAVALQFVVWGAELSRAYRARNSTIRAALGTLRYPHPSDPEVRFRVNVVPSRVALTAASSDPDRPPGDNGLPPYIARDIDPELRHHLNDALAPVGDASRRWLLIEGPPHAGATRTAYEALIAVGRDNPGLCVLIPGRDASAAKLVSDYLNLRVPDRQRDPCVLVLDALDRFLQPVAIPLDRLAALAESSPRSRSSPRSERASPYRPAPQPNCVIASTKSPSWETRRPAAMTRSRPPAVRLGLPYSSSWVVLVSASVGRFFS